MLACATSYAQNIEDYYKFDCFYWKIDSVIVLTEDSPLRPSSLQINSSGIYISEYEVSVFIRNKADEAIYVKHEGSISWDDGSQVLISSRYKFPPEEVAIGDNTSLRLYPLVCDKKIIDTKKMKKRYRADGKDIPFRYKIDFPIIYKDRRTDFRIFISGFYRGKK